VTNKGYFYHEIMALVFSVLNTISSESSGIFLHILIRQHFWVFLNAKKCQMNKIKESKVKKREN